MRSPSESLTVRVLLPDGTVRRISDRSPAAETKLSDWLEHHDVPLNTRCGGRGLCNGCRVEIERKADTGGDIAPKGRVRSCTLRMSDILGNPPRQLRVPDSSFRDRGLHGVNVFELETGILPVPAGRTGLGFAVDIGTTTVAIALWDLTNGVCLGTAGRANGQACYGDNVLSRITCSLEGPGNGDRLRTALVDDTLAPLFKRLLEEAGRRPDEVAETTVAGNPVMLHTLLGESLEGFSRFPFRPVFLGGRTVEGGDIGLADSSSVVHLLPGLGPFVGADVFAGAVAAGLAEPGEAALLIDFGTNGEILLRSRDGFLATATAAGPAFEGGRLMCGSAARSGVVSALEWSDRGWSWRLSGEGTGRPIGIAGSAYVDFIAEAHAAGFLNSFGRLDPASPFVSEVPEDDGDGVSRRCLIDGDVYVAETDVAELLQAKAAIAGGVASLLEEADMDVPDIQRVYVAGGFGYHLHPGRAVAVGLLPRVEPSRIRVIGNSSLGGASLCLLRGVDQLPKVLLENTRVVELNQMESFEDHFTDALTIPEA